VVRKEEVAASRPSSSSSSAPTSSSTTRYGRFSMYISFYSFNNLVTLLSRSGSSRDSEKEPPQRNIRGRGEVKARDERRDERKPRRK
jgi:hypothetical protein